MSSSAPRRGKFFFIRHKSLPDFILEAEGGGKDPGSDVVLGEFQWEKGLKSAEHQLWYYDRLSRTIRCKLTGFCMQVNDDSHVVVGTFASESDHQKWKIDGDRITELYEDRRLGIDGSVVSPGAKCQVMASGENQFWIIDYQPPFYLYIKPQSNRLLVIDVRKANQGPGAKVILYENKGDLADNQLWFEDENGIMRSKMNGFAMDATGKEVRMMPYDQCSVNQQWVLGDNVICSCLMPSRMLHMRPGSLFCSATLVAVETSPSHTGKLHLWSFEYIPQELAALSHSGCGKYFTISSHVGGGGLVLEVEGKLIEVGAAIVLAQLEAGSQCQHFYIDDTTGTIRSVLRNYCIDIDDSSGFLVLSPFDPYRKEQQLIVSGKKIQSRHDVSIVLQLDGSEPGSHVKTASFTGGDMQHFDINHLMSRCFYVISVWNGKVLDVSGDEASAGGKLIVYERKSNASPNQLWYEDEQGLLRSKLNGYVIDTSDEVATLRPFNASNSKQQWIIVGDRIQNKYDNKLVLDIYGKSALTAVVGEYRFHGGENQRWKFEIV